MSMILLGQTIIPIFLPMPFTGDMPADEINIVALVTVGLLSLVVGFGIGILLHDKIFR